MMARLRQGKGRGQDKQGRSKGAGRFLKIEHFMLKSCAWRSLSPTQRVLYIELVFRYNGSNNGHISLSVRGAAKAVRCGKDTATKAFHVLEERGFIRRNVCGSFDWKAKQATTWILTEHSYNNSPATKDFMRWREENLEPGPKLRTNSPKGRTLPLKSNGFRLRDVPHLGPKH